MLRSLPVADAAPPAASSLRRGTLGVTRVASVQIYDHVEALEYAEAHGLAAWLVGFSFLALLLLYGLQRRRRPA